MYKRTAQCLVSSSRAVVHNTGEEELASTLSKLKLTRGSACPCVWRGCIKGEDVAAIVHGDDITIGGERSAVKVFIKTISRKYGEDPDIRKEWKNIESCFFAVVLFVVCFFFFSLSTDLHSAVVQQTHLGSCTHMDRTGLEFNLSWRNKNSSHCHLDVIHGSGASLLRLPVY